MEASGIPRQGGPIGVMLLEHTEGREYVAALKEGIEIYKEQGPEATDLIIQPALNYMALLRQHIEKEDNILFQIANMHIPPEKMKALEVEFEKAEEKMGVEKGKELLGIVAELKEIYLGR